MTTLEVALKVASNEAIKNAIEPLIIGNQLKKASEMIYKTFNLSNFSNFGRRCFVSDMVEIFKNNKYLDKVFEMTSLYIPMITGTSQIEKPIEYRESLQLLRKTTILDIIKIGVKLSETEPDFISKYPNFASLVGALYNDGIRPDIIKNLPSSILYDIAVKLLESGQPQKAMSVVNEIDDPDYQERVLELRNLKWLRY